MPKNTASAFVITKNYHFLVRNKKREGRENNLYYKKDFSEIMCLPLARCYQAGKIKLYELNYSPKKQRVYPCLS